MKEKKFEGVWLIAETKDDMATFRKDKNGIYYVTHVMGIKLSKEFELPKLPIPTEKNEWWDYRPEQINHNNDIRIKATVMISKQRFRHYVGNTKVDKFPCLDGFQFTIFQDDSIEIAEVTYDDFVYLSPEIKIIQKATRKNQTDDDINNNINLMY